MSPKESKAREKEFRRNEIIEAARSIFHDKGFERATMDDIAIECDYTKKTIYSYFKSKEELFGTLALEALSLLVQIFQDAVKEGKTGFEQVAHIGSSYFSFFRNNPVEFSILSVKIDIKMKSPLFTEILKQNERMITIIASAFQKGIKDGSVRKDIDPLKAALYVVTISRGMLELVSQNIDDFEKFYGINIEEFFKYSLSMMGESFKSK